MPKTNTNTLPYFLALLSSGFYAIWAILSLVLVNTSGASFIVSLYSIYIVFVIAAWVLVLLYARNRKHFNRNMIKIGIGEGLLYTGGTGALFYALTYTKAFPLTEMVSYSSIVIFAVLVRRVNRSREGIRYFFATLAAFAGIAEIVFGVYGSGFSFASAYLVSLPIIALFYGFAAYYTFYPMEKNYNPIAYNAIPISTQVAVLGPAIFLLGLQNQFFSLGPQSWIYATAIAAALLVGYLADLYAFRIGRKAKAGVIDTINILTNMELVGVAIFSVLYLQLNWVYIGLGTLFVILGTIALQKEG